ncbi:hypothetical protein AMECASPLE_002081, partial [Ameca splendens]
MRERFDDSFFSPMRNAKHFQDAHGNSGGDAEIISLANTHVSMCVMDNLQEVGHEMHTEDQDRSTEYVADHHIST